MHVAHVITRLVLGGASKILISTVKDQCRRGFRVKVFTGPSDGSGKWLTGEITKMGASCELVSGLRREPSLIEDIRAVFSLYRAFRSERYDVVHLYTSKAGFLGSIAGRLSGASAIIYAPQGHIFSSGNRLPGVPEGGWKRNVFYYLRRLACALFCRASHP